MQDAWCVWTWNTLSLYSYLMANLTRKISHWEPPPKRKPFIGNILHFNFTRMYLTYILYTHFVNGLLQQSYTNQFLIQSYYKSGDLLASTVVVWKIAYKFSPSQHSEKQSFMLLHKGGSQILTRPIRQIWGAHFPLPYQLKDDIQNHLSFILLFLLLPFAVHLIGSPEI
jgi:hypothetical protein